MYACDIMHLDACQFENKLMKQILCVYDVYSSFASVCPITSETSRNIAEAFLKIGALRTDPAKSEKIRPNFP